VSSQPNTEDFYLKSRILPKEIKINLLNPFNGLFLQLFGIDNISRIVQQIETCGKNSCQV
jgi:hypothetical protein